MKKLFLLLFVGVLTISCSSDDSSDVNITNADLVGSWDVTSYVSETTQTVTTQGITVTSNVSGIGKDFDFVTTFVENPNTATAQGSMTLTTTTTVPGQQDVIQDIPLNSLDGLDSTTWSLNGNVITFTDNNDQVTTAVITSFSGNTLTLKATTDQTQDIFGTIVQISGTVDITLEKQ